MRELEDLCKRTGLRRRHDGLLSACDADRQLRALSLNIAALVIKLSSAKIAGPDAGLRVRRMSGNVRGVGRSERTARSGGSNDRASAYESSVVGGTGDAGSGCRTGAGS